MAPEVPNSAANTISRASPSTRLATLPRKMIAAAVATRRITTRSGRTRASGARAAVEAQDGRQLAQVGDAQVLAAGASALAVDQHRQQPGAARALDVVGHAVAHVCGLRGRHVEAPQRQLEDAGIGLLHAVVAR